MGIIINLETLKMDESEFPEMSKATTICLGKEISAYGATTANAMYNLLEKLDDMRTNVEVCCNTLRDGNVLLYNNEKKITETTEILQDFNKLKCMKKDTPTELVGKTVHVRWRQLGIPVIGVVKSYDDFSMARSVKVLITDPDVCKIVCENCEDGNRIKDIMLNGYTICANLDDIEILN